MRNSGKQEAMDVCILILRYSLWNNVTHLLPLKNCHILPPWHGHLEEVIQNEANGMEGSHRPIILNNALSQTFSLRARFILLPETIKNKKQTMKKWYWIKICEGQWTVRRELLIRGRKKSYTGHREGVWKEVTWKKNESPPRIHKRYEGLRRAGYLSISDGELCLWGCYLSVFLNSSFSPSMSNLLASLVSYFKIHSESNHFSPPPLPPP